tara:strand:+ start:438 stop:662 length:225 start_codon:yes stop_codon:yes gene_type:complete
VPAFNESEVIREILCNLLNYFSNVMVVDDGSTDNIKEVVKDLDIILINHEINLGVGVQFKQVLILLKRFLYRMQ